MCTAFTETQSTLPIGASGLRSANRVSAFTGYFRLAPFQQLHVSFGTVPSSCPRPQERQQLFSDGDSDLPLHPAERLLKLAGSASRRGGQESIPRVLVAAAEVTTSLGPGQSRVGGVDSNRHRSGRLILLTL